MTCRYSGTEWLDVLYTSVRNTPGGVADAANFLTLRRGRGIAPESLRLRLRGEGENRLSMEMFELLIEWMQEKKEGAPFALDPLHALNERFGLIAEHGAALNDSADDDQQDVESLNALPAPERRSAALLRLPVASFCSTATVFALVGLLRS
ncbi:hypothetical protein [Paraburkholderia sediminicola]|uniref:hypothetical protein n=1 Tax=Paraburkholderia sediminicola TaxID=458836 RepID=UPI0038B71BC2